LRHSQFDSISPSEPTHNFAQVSLHAQAPE
jgi:hypothetical protein